MTLQTQAKAPLVIGLTGKKGTGKDTVANYLVTNYYAHKLSFVQVIRDGLAAMLRVDPIIFEARDMRERPIRELVPTLRIDKTPRQMMQLLASEWGRQMIQSDLWIAIAEHASRHDMESCDFVVISDMRKDDEAEWVHKHNGWVVEIINPRVHSDDTHDTERGVSRHLIDATLINDADIPTLLARTEELMADLVPSYEAAQMKRGLAV